MNPTKFHPLSPALLSRIGRLSGCQGRWIVDCRELEGSYSSALRSLSDYWPYQHGDGHRYWHSLDGLPNLFKLSSPEDAAQYCAATGWRARLLYCADWLNADCSWPGGYSASSLHRSNNRTFSDNYSEELLLADGDADGLSLDIRFATDEMIETIESLEGYPLISEDDHSHLEMEDQEEAWQDWAERDFRRLLEGRLAELLPEGQGDRAEETVEGLTSSELCRLFHALSEAANEYWQEESCHGWWIDLDKIVLALSDEELLSLSLEIEGSPLSPVETLLASMGRL